jgi:hypothetical protein
MTEVPNSEPKHEPTDAGPAVLNKQARPKWQRLAAPRFNEAAPGNADRAMTGVPKSAAKYKPEEAERAALNKQAQCQKDRPVAPRLNEAGLGDANRDTTEVPNSAPKYEPTDAGRTITEVPKYEPNDAERATLNRQAQKQKEQPPAPRFNVVEDYRGIRVEQDHPDSVVARLLLKDALGTADDDFCRGLLAQLGVFDNGDSALAETELNFLLSVIKNGKPKDELHAMLLALMGVTFQVPMRTARNFGRIERDLSSIGKDVKDPFVIRELNSLTKNLSLLLDSTERSFNRCARTYAILLEASDRHRRSGEPSMTVQQLTVAEGGQAIVANNITHATPQTAPNNPAAAPRALTDQQHSAMPIIAEPERVPVPVRRRKRQ